MEVCRFVHKRLIVVCKRRNPDPTITGLGKNGPELFFFFFYVAAPTEPEEL